MCKPMGKFAENLNLSKRVLPPCYVGRGRIRLPKFKFSANFPIGLHVILQTQIKKNQKCLISYVKKSIEV